MYFLSLFTVALLKSVYGASIEHVVSLSTEPSNSLNVETTGLDKTGESVEACVFETKWYKQYFDMFTHYEAWERYKWLHVYGVENMNGDAYIEDLFWEDFIVEAPFDSPQFYTAMEFLRNASEMITMKQLQKIVCDVHDFSYDDDFYF